MVRVIFLFFAKVKVVIKPCGLAQSLLAFSNVLQSACKFGGVETQVTV